MPACDCHAYPAASDFQTFPARGQQITLPTMMLCLAIIAVGCGGTPSTPSSSQTSQQTTSLAVSGPASIAAGQSAQFSATATLSNGTQQSVTAQATWTSSNPLVATVSGSGLVSAVGAGQSDIRATWSGATGTARTSVSTPPQLRLRIVTNPGFSTPVAGANVQVEGTAAVLTAGDGLATFPSAAIQRKVVISAAGFLTRESYLKSDLSGDLTIDIISLASPFSLSFYRELGRNFEGVPNITTWLRLAPDWKDKPSPNFYIRTVDLQGGPVAQSEIDTISQAILRVVPQASGGRVSVGRIETGSEDRTRERGWVYFTLTSSSIQGVTGGELCGSVTTPQFLSSNLAPVQDITVVHNQGSCLSSCGAGARISAGLVAHELGHIMGLRHTSSYRDTTMYPTIAACRGELTPLEEFHAGIIYSRPPSNDDPDVDAPQFPLGSLLRTTLRHR